MIILANSDFVSVVIRDTDMLEDNKRFYAFSNGGYFDPENNFKPCFKGAEKRRRLHDSYVERYKEMLSEAETAYGKRKALYETKLEKQEQPQQTPAPQQSGLGGQLEQALLQVLAEQSTAKVMETAKPIIDNYVRETYGTLPQVHVVKTATETKQMEGVMHEKFETVMNLVNADIPVFLTGAAGTGKNVICKQVAEALGLEFFFSNAVTQEYKLTGFIDANGTYHETQFYKAFTEGGLFMLDEMDASIPEVLIILNAAIANRYFDFPTGRVEANENFRLIAAGNTYGTGADIEYTGRFQLDAASLDRFALVEIDYSQAIESAIARGNEKLVTFIRAFRSATRKAGVKHLATYRSIERITKLEGVMTVKETLKICLFKSLAKDDLRMLVNDMDLSSDNNYLVAMKQLAS